jgi:cytoskeletal protein CcmA (bactofilin family)
MGKGKVKARAAEKKTIGCYLCGRRFDVSARAMTVSCPTCHRQLMVEDVTVKGHRAVTHLPSCGTITITARGRVVAKKVMGDVAVLCDGTVEGDIESSGFVRIGRKAKCHGAIRAGRLEIAEGAIIDADIVVPWNRQEHPSESMNGVGVPSSTPR